MMLNLGSAAGCIALCALAWAAGGFRRPVAWRTVLGGFALLAVLGSLVFLFPPSRAAFLHLNDAVLAVLSAGTAGARFLFGPLALNPGETMRFVNDHDPLPLLDQLALRYGEAVTIRYVQREPGAIAIDFVRN